MFIYRELQQHDRPGMSPELLQPLHSIHYGLDFLLGGLNNLIDRHDRFDSSHTRTTEAQSA